MRIVIDLQACQSTGSRTRGIGRYSLALAQAMVRQAPGHDFILLMNGLFPETIAPLREQFATLVPAENMRVWQAAAPVNEHDPANLWRCRAGELLREQAIAELRPDFVHVTSLFEGSGDNAVTSVSASREYLPTAVTLYDLIPLIYQDIYLPHPQVRDWYFRKMQALKNADLALAISESSRQEAMNWLQLPADHVVNISSAVDERFHVRNYAPDVLGDLRARYCLHRPFVMYTGGIDHRKNIDALIRAFGLLPPALRQRYQLAIVCSVHKAEREKFLRIAEQAGLAREDVVFTGFVPDSDLPILYNSCELFVFPSWHEGFGLPALEAMACGAPVIGANTSSLPEVIGLEAAMFDPRDDGAICARMQQALSDDGFRARLRENGRVQAGKFSWDASARRAIAAIEAVHRQQGEAAVQVAVPVPARKPKLACVTPLPPQHSGIADYCAQLIPELARHYDIDVFVSQPEVTVPRVTANFTIRHWQSFDGCAGDYDRILYHFGNSGFHSFMFDMLERHPGIVVLHDFYLSGILSHLDVTGEKPRAWDRALYASHGYHAMLARYRASALYDVVMQYPCNGEVLDLADGIIVHAEHSVQLARHWYGPEAAACFADVPLLRRLPIDVRRDEARRQLQLGSGDFLVCSFGGLGNTKLNHRLLRAWLDSPLAQDRHCHLVFVGANAGGDYGEQIAQAIAASGHADRVRITGYVEPALYRAYLCAADAAVQLRAQSRGETSAVALDCLAYGIPTIVNAHAAMAELPGTALLKLPDSFSDDALAEQLTTLRANPVLREALSRKAVAHVGEAHRPVRVAARYAEAIERFAEREPRARRRRTIAAIARIGTSVRPDDGDLQATSRGLAASFSRSAGRHIWIDVTDAASGKSGVDDRLAGLLGAPPAGYRVEPVLRADDQLRFARTFACKLLGMPPLPFGDDGIEARPGDLFVGDSLPPELQAIGVRWLASLDEVAHMTEPGKAHAHTE